MANGACVIDLASYLLQDPWDEIQRTFQIPLPAGSRPLRAEVAQESMQRMAGVPVKSLERMVQDWDFDAVATEVIQAARAAGIATVLALDAPQAVLQGLTQRVGGDAIAGLSPEVVLGRLTGILIQPSWEGACGDAVCLATVARAAGEDFASPIWIVSASRGCPCVRGKTVTAAEFRQEIAVTA